MVHNIILKTRNIQRGGGESNMNTTQLSVSNKIFIYKQDTNCVLILQQAIIFLCFPCSQRYFQMEQPAVLSEMLLLSTS